LRSRDGVIDGVGFDDVRRLYGFRRVAMPGGSGLTIVVGLPIDSAYEASNERLRVSLLILVAVAAITFVVAHQVSDRLFTRRIDGLLRAARRLSAGDLSARSDQPWSDDELGELARTFDSMAWAVGQRTEDLRHMMESLRALGARLESVREEERTRISREIHDELGQTLTGIRMDLDRLEERVAGAHGLPEGERNQIDRKILAVRKLVDAGLETARRISRQLRPSVLDVLGLRAGIEWQLEEFRARTGIDSDLLAGADDLTDLGEDVATALFRILQEALTNVMRHAHATMVTVRIEREPDAIVMEVMDNGRGFEQGDRPYPVSLGLLGMRERAASLGGMTTITSQPGRGTIVHVRVPLKRAPAV
jgi:signal transduction histidine kinase